MKTVLVSLLLGLGIILIIAPSAVSLSLIEEVSFTIPNVENIEKFYMKDINWDGNAEILLYDGNQVLLYSHHEDAVLNSFPLGSYYGFTKVELLLEDITRDGVADIAVGTFDTFGKCRITVVNGLPIDSVVTREYMGNIFIYGPALTGLIEFKASDLNQDGYKELFVSYDSSSWNKNGLIVNSSVSGITKCFYSFPDSLMIDNHNLIADLIEYSEGHKYYPNAVYRSGSYIRYSGFYSKSEYFENPVLLNPDELFGSQLLDYPIIPDQQNKSYYSADMHYSSILFAGNLITTMPGVELFVSKLWVHTVADPPTTEYVSSYGIYNVQTGGEITEVWKIIESDIPFESNRPSTPVYHPDYSGSFFGFMNTPEYPKNQLYRFKGSDGSITDTIGQPVVEGKRSWVYPFDDTEPYLAVINGNSVTLYKIGQITDADGGEDLPLPSQFSIGKPYPNPFNATQTIPIFNLTGKSLRVEIYNLLGQKVETVFNGKLQPSEIELTWQADHLPSGLYFIKATSGDQSQIVKTILLK